MPLRRRPTGVAIDTRHQIALPRISVDDMGKDLALAPLAPRLESLAQQICFAVACVP